jgi:prepilin-type N-terminal cleavage/methylation domain-containing protein
MKPARGMTLIEVMVAMTVLAVGLVAMWKMHVIGITSTAAGRRHSIAAGLARELVSGLEQVPFADPLVAETGPTGPVPPAVFGQLVQGDGTIVAGARVWDDAAPVPGVRLATARDPFAETSAAYTRRWTVWGFTPAAGSPSTVKIIAVSVTWLDPPFARPREVVEYTFVTNPGTTFQNLGANL